MKGHKAHHHAKHMVHHHHYAKGGHVQETPEHGMREWEQDLHSKPEMRSHAPGIEHEAEAKKHGGRAKRKHGGHVKHHAAGGMAKHHAAGGMAKHHEHGKHLAHAKHVGPVTGHKAVHHAGRKPRARGGADMNPLSSAHAGTPPRGHKDRDID